jgi:chemotaxis signal transduction protein
MYPFPSASHPEAAKPSTPLRMMVFAIADYFFALPINVVLKVVNCPPLLLSSSLSSIELVHLGLHTITLLKLQQHLAPGQLQQQANTAQFLVVTQLVQQELCAILVDAPPNLIEIPLSAIRTLPESYRQAHPLHKIASHIAVLPQEETSLSIFLLDMEQVLKTLTRSLAQVPEELTSVVRS